jgi:hypothetical protein
MVTDADRRHPAAPGVGPEPDIGAEAPCLASRRLWCTSGIEAGRAQSRRSPASWSATSASGQKPCPPTSPSTAGMPSVAAAVVRPGQWPDHDRVEPIRLGHRLGHGIDARIAGVLETGK